MKESILKLAKRFLLVRKKPEKETVCLGLLHMIHKVIRNRYGYIPTKKRGFSTIRIVLKTVILIGC